MVQVPQGVVSLIAQPPFGILSREVGFVLTPGLTQIQRIRGPVTVDAFGVSFSFVTVPAAFGSTIEVATVYEDPIVWFAPVYTDFTGHDFYAEPTQVKQEGLFYLFPQVLPTRVDVRVQVGCTVQQFWLVAL